MNKVYISDPKTSLAPSGTQLDIDLIDFYTDDKLWEKTNCPFGTEHLIKEVYDRVNLGELWDHDIEEELVDKSIEFLSTNGSLTVGMQWDHDEEPASVNFYTTMYSYKGYTYLIKYGEMDGCSQYTMSREPERNKKELYEAAATREPTGTIPLYKQF